MDTIRLSFDQCNDICHSGDLAVAMGAFDGVHLGHRALIRQVITLAEAEGLKSGVITFEPHPQIVLHPERNLRLISDINEKELLLTQLGIDKMIVVPFSPEVAQMSSEQFLSDVLSRQLHIHTLFIGFDHHFGHDKGSTFQDYRQTALRHGIRCLRGAPYGIDREQPVSSTAIRRWIDTGAIKEVNRQLGYRYMILGRVVSGLKVGRTIGYPTANVQILSEHKALPPAGVYMAYTTIDPKKKSEPGRYKQNIPGMLYIGTRPTLELAENTLTVEVHLMDGQHYDLYGQEVQLSLCDRLRQELHFETIEALRKQISRDEQAIRRYFCLP